jgi:FAD/FMN-containing dehydrogenase
MTSNPAQIPLTQVMNGRVVMPGAPGYDEARSGFNLALDQRPAAVVYPISPGDVAAVIDYARAFDLRVAPQATGHNIGAHGALEDVVLLSTADLKEISIDAAARSVRVGAGVRWHEVVPQLSERGLAALHGSSPLVGIAGYSLGGGMGWLARKYGLQTNSVTALEVVTADGRFVRTDKHNEPDLFWALRGGNGNFGVVTAIEFDVYPVAELYAGALFFPFERAREVLHAWNDQLPSAPEELMTWANFLHFPPDPALPEPLRGGSFVIVMGAFLGSEAEGAELMRPVRDLGPVMDTFAMVPPEGIAELAMDPPMPLPFASGTHMLDEVPASAIDDIVDAAGPGSDSSLVLVQLRHMGGELARVEPGAGARATLPGELCVFALGIVEDEASGAAVQASLARLAEALEGHETTAPYPNFVEEPADARAFFDEVTWARLRRVKAAYDPADVFKGNHHIAPA